MTDSEPDRITYEKEYDMLIEELDILNKWKPNSELLRTQEKRWNHRAEEFSKRPMPTVNDHLFLKNLLEITDIGPDTTVLDIGSGGGHLSIALAPYVKSALGLDVSGNMVKHASESAKEYNADNVRFVHKDWGAMASDDPLIENGFDIVFAHMTPAIGKAADFIKMMDIAKKYLFMTKPVRRHNPTEEGMWKHMGIEPLFMSSDKDLAFAFMLGWQRGFNPQFFYEDRIWDNIITVDEALEKYKHEFSFRDLKFDEDEVREYFESVAEDGIVNDSTYTEIATIYWKVQK